MERDPNGRSASAPGSKLDAGKTRVALVLGGFPLALMEVAKVGTFGANKYTARGWETVPNAIERYDDASGRHMLKEQAGELTDPDSNLMHRAHRAWNELAVLELILREQAAKVPMAPIPKFEPPMSKANEAAISSVINPMGVEL